LTIHPGFVNTEGAAHDRFPRPFAMETADAVRIMARAIDRGAAATAFPFPLAALARTVGVLPRALYESLARGRRKG
jgi:short-subunit dehydrogenase